MQHRVFTLTLSSFNRAAVAAAAGSLLLTACGGGGGGGSNGAPGAEGPSRQVSLRFAAMAGELPAGCGAPLAALGSGALQADLKDLRFYVSEWQLVKASGEAVPVALADNAWQSPAAGVALIDLEDGSGPCAERGTAQTNATVEGSVPAGDYVGARLTIGVPSAFNHGDTVAAAKPLDIQAMAWSWQAGRKFLKIEVAPAGGVSRPANPDTEPPTPADTRPIFNVHVGSTGCSGNPATGEVVACLAPNRLTLDFPRFDPERQRIELDLQALFLGNNLSADLGGAFGCMSAKSDPECVATFAALGIDLASGLTQGMGQTQRVFRVGQD